MRKRVFENSWGGRGEHGFRYFDYAVSGDKIAVYISFKDYNDWGGASVPQAEYEKHKTYPLDGRKVTKELLYEYIIMAAKDMGQSDHLPESPDELFGRKPKGKQKSYSKSQSQTTSECHDSLVTVSDKYRYYKFTIGNGVMRRKGARVELLGKNGEWEEKRDLLTKFIGGDSDFDEITEAQAQEIADNRRSERRGKANSRSMKLFGLFKKR